MIATCTRLAGIVPRITNARRASVMASSRYTRAFSTDDSMQMHAHDEHAMHTSHRVFVIASANKLRNSDRYQAGIVGMKNPCTIAITCAFVSGSSNASLAAVAATKLLVGRFGSMDKSTEPCIVLFSSPA